MGGRYHEEKLTLVSAANENALSELLERLSYLKIIVILWDAVRWVGRDGRRRNWQQFERLGIPSAAILFHIQANFAHSNSLVIFTTMTMRGWQVCVECVRLFGCLHSWADGGGRTSHNTQTTQCKDSRHAGIYGKAIKTSKRGFEGMCL